MYVKVISYRLKTVFRVHFGPAAAFTGLFYLCNPSEPWHISDYQLKAKMFKTSLGGAAIGLQSSWKK